MSYNCEQELDKLCLLLYYRDKVHKKRRQIISKVHRLREQLRNSSRFLTHSTIIKQERVIENSDYKRRLIGKFMKQNQKELTTQRLKAGVDICWDGGGNFDWVWLKYEKRRMTREEVFKRAEDYIIQLTLIEGRKRIANPYSDYQYNKFYKEYNV